jgi:hypothetical protein
MTMLVLSGEKSGGGFLIDQARLVDMNVAGIVITGSVHSLMEEAPEQTIAALVSFINGQAGGKASKCAPYLPASSCE